MHYRTFYQLTLLLPLVIPACVALVVHVFGYRPESGFARATTQLGLMTFLYGGIPYTAVMLGASVWVRRRSEADIRRMAKRAPLLMVAAFVVLAAYVGIRSRQLDMFLGFSALGAAMSLLVGYLVVALVFALRYVAGRVGLVVAD